MTTEEPKLEQIGVTCLALGHFCAGSRWWEYLFAFAHADFSSHRGFEPVWCSGHTHLPLFCTSTVSFISHVNTDSTFKKNKHSLIKVYLGP